MRIEKNLYKYMGAEIFNMVFEKDGFCSLKCSYPKDYNDPYELFLTINFNQTPDVLAFYREVVSEIEQYPTTCFSKSPVVIPMWAHYANNGIGFVIEFDEEKLSNHINYKGLDDVAYQNESRSEIEKYLQMAYQIGKPRHLMFLRQAAYYAAYFTKSSCWNYEQERRLIVKDDDIEHIFGNMILYVPLDCVSKIVAGPRVGADFLQQAIDLSKKHNIPFFQINLGRTTSIPYLLNNSLETHIFDGNRVVKSPFSCSSCKEPKINDDNELCSWCLISEKHERDASVNAFRMMERAGILDDYVKTFNEVGK